MADDVGSLRVSLSLDSADFSQSMASVDRSLRTLGGELSIIRAQGQDYGQSLDGLRNRHEVLGRTLTAQDLKVRQLREAYEQSRDSTGENSIETERLAAALNRGIAAHTRTQTEINQVNQALNDQESQLRQSENQWNQLGVAMQETGRRLSETGDHMKKVGEGLTKGVTAPILAVGAAGILAFNQVDEALDTIITKTGATGKSAEGLSDSFSTVASRVPDDLTSVGEAIGEVNTQFGFMGKELEDASQLMLQFANINGTDVTSSSIAAKQAIEAYGLANSDLGSVLDAVTKTAQDTGQSVDFLFEKATAGAPQIKALGLSFAEGTALIGGFEKAGVDSGASLSSLAKAQVAFAKDGKTMEEGLNGTIKAILGAKSETEALTIASATFGTKGATRMVDAIQRGTFNLSEFSNAGANAAGTVKNTFNETLDPIDQAAIAMNNAKLAMAEVGAAIQVALLPFLTKATKDLGELADWFKNLSPEMKNTILVVAGLAAAIGPLLVMIGSAVSAVGTIISALGGLSLAMETAGVSATFFGVSLAILTSPITLIIAAIAALVVGGVLLYKNWDKIMEMTPLLKSAILSLSPALTLIVGSIKLFQKANEDALEKTNVLGEGVDKNTAKMLDSYVKFNEKATAAFTSLSIEHGNITQSQADKVNGIYQGMADAAVASIEKRKQDEITALTDMFADSYILSMEEEQKRIDGMVAHKDAEKAQIQSYSTQIQDIYSKAAQEHRDTTDAENAEIQNLQEKMNAVTVTSLTDNQAQQKVILERMRDQAGEITAQQSAKVVQESIKTRDKVIADATDTRDKKIAEIIRQRDETGTISAAEADKMISEANKSYDSTVKTAKNQHKDIVAEAKAQAGEHASQVDFETGQIKTKWDVMRDNIGTTMSSIGDKIKTGWNDAWTATKKTVGDIKDEAIKEFSNMITSIIGAFAKMVITIPTPKLPSINVGSKTLFGGKGGIPAVEIPTFDISWHANGGVFEKPAIFGNAGFGDVEEAIVPLAGRHASKFAGLVAKEMEKQPTISSGLTQNVVINSPKPTSPSENARLLKRVGQQQAMEWGIR
jgi:TP901 family phage tail tape measure protein